MLQAAMEANDDGSGIGKLSFLLTTLTEEFAEELVEKDDMQVRVLFYQFGETISWIGHGDNTRLPEMLMPFAETINPTLGGDNANADNAGTESPYPQLDSATR